MLAQSWIELLKEQGLGTSLLMGGAAMIAVWLMMRGRLRRDHQAAHAATPAERIAQIKQTHGVRDDLTRMMVELEEMARHVSSQLDVRQAELERLIHEAEERADRLEAMLNACGVAEDFG